MRRQQIFCRVEFLLYSTNPCPVGIVFIVKWRTAGGRRKSPFTSGSISLFPFRNNRVKAVFPPVKHLKNRSGGVNKCPVSTGGERFREGDRAKLAQTSETRPWDLPKKEAWRKAAPHVSEISIPRGNKEPDQPTLWYHSGTKERKPLFLVLHSWSADYLQYDGIPDADQKIRRQKRSAKSEARQLIWPTRAERASGYLSAGESRTTLFPRPTA